MNDEVVFVKDPKTNHYRYMEKNEFKNKNVGLRIMTFLFWILVLAFIIGIAYYIYCDYYEVYLVDGEMTIDNGTTYQVELLPKNSKRFNYNNYVFESENPSVASVDSLGQVTAVSNGNTNIIVKFRNGYSKKYLTVNVSNINVEKIELEKTLVIDKNDTKNVKVKVNNKNNINTKVKYESNNPHIATVDDNGNIIGVNEGETTIIAKTPSGKTAETKVIIKSTKEEIQYISLNKTSLELESGQKKELIVSVTPSSASTKDLKWTSSNPSVATVDNNGNVTALKAGTTNITVKTNNNLDSICVVTVKEKEFVVLNTYNEELEVGKSVRIISNIDVSWSSSNTSVASVTSSGVVTALNPGTTTILAKSNNTNTNSCLIVVKEKEVVVEESKVIEPTKITLSTQDITLTEGESKSIGVSYTPSDVTTKGVTWSSSDPSVATVDANGNVKAISKGQALITAKYKNNSNIKSEVYITVNARIIDVNNVALDKSSVKVAVGNTTTLTATVSPSNANNKSVTWSSSDTSIATVTSNGVVSAKKNGTATITVKTNNGKTSNCTVTVYTPTVNVTSVSITSNVTSIYVGDIASLGVIVEPNNATNKKVTWQSSNTSIATVDSNGKVTGKSDGSVKITVTSVDNPLATDTKSIVVRTKPIAVTAIELSTYKSSMYVGDSYQFKTTITPSNASDKTITWSSSNTSVATVDSNGKVTAKSKGETIIYAKSSDKNISVQQKITVLEKINVTSVALKSQHALLEVGKTYQLTATITPSNATDKTVTYTSSKTEVATVSDKGLITAKKKGVAQITVKTTNGKKDTINVIVQGATIEKKYESSTLRYYIERPESKYIVSRIWVKDSYKQVKVAMMGEMKNPRGGRCDSEYYKTNRGYTLYDVGKAYEIFENEIKVKGYQSKGMIAINASTMITDEFFVDCPCNWYGQSRTLLVINNGKVIRQSDYNACKTSGVSQVLGVNKSGNLKYYAFDNSRPTTEAEKSTIASSNKTSYQKVIDDGVQNTFGNFGVLVSNYERKATDESKNIRQAVCQIDKNNFLLITSTPTSQSQTDTSQRENGLSKVDLANIMISYGCRIGFNLDGGQSTAYYYKTNSSQVNYYYTRYQMRSNGNGTGTYRDLADMLYFVEQ